MPRRRTNFSDSLIKNKRSYYENKDRLTELAVSMFEWKNLPKTVNARYIEMCLFEKGKIVAFNDEVVGFLMLPVTIRGNFDVYGEPILRRAYSSYNNYLKDLDNTNSVICYNNYMRKPSYQTVELYAQRLYEYDCAIDINAKAQKTPILLLCPEEQRLVLENLYKEYEGNSPVIKGEKGLDRDSITAIVTGAPFVADNLYQLKMQIWNECLTALGISNINIQKKERLITDEVTRNQGGTMASRFSRLDMRKQFCEQVNDMFKLNIDVDYKEDLNPLVEAKDDGLDREVEEDE